MALIIAGGLRERGIGMRILTGKLPAAIPRAGKAILLHHDGRLRRARTRHHPRAAQVADRRPRPGPHQQQGPRHGRRQTRRKGPARRASGESPTQIAPALGVSRASIYRHLAATPGRQALQDQ